MSAYLYILASKRHGTLYTGSCANPVERIARERSVKRWKREWKIALIEQHNPGWRDLYPELNDLMVF